MIGLRSLGRALSGVACVGALRGTAWAHTPAGAAGGGWGDEIALAVGLLFGMLAVGWAMLDRRRATKSWKGRRGRAVR